MGAPRFSGSGFIHLCRPHQNMILSMCLLIGGITSSANALEWNDKHWKDLGCPENISGNWISRYGQNSIKFEDHQIIAKTKNGKASIYLHNDSLQALGNRFISITLKSKTTTGEQLKFIKIRPHMAIAQGDFGQPVCSIKIFNFDSQKQVKFDKYKSWDIFEKK